MEIIISHDHTDLDGLAAMIAARSLYSRAKPVLVGRLSSLARDFMALYRGTLEVYELEDIDPDEVTRVIVVDTADINRLGDLCDHIDLNEVEVIVYDHHPHDSSSSDWIDLDMSENVGSSTTIIVNRLIREGKEPNPVEATLFALGIYADTGNFTHMSTTAADLKAAAHLLDFGARTRIINQFLEERLDEEQQRALEKLLKGRQELKINGTGVSIFSADFSRYIMGLNKVTRRIKNLYDLASIFVVAGGEDKVDLIGRSSDEAVDIGQICSHFQGGGHPGAGSARLDMSLERARQELIEVLQTEITRMNCVRSIMSSPVRTINPEATVAEAGEMMEKYGHSGLIVVDEEDEVVGIFSRRDLEKIMEHDLLNAPVKGYMSDDVITISPEATIRDAQELMVKYDIGRLPVMKDDEMVGIVTRTDVLASYYEDASPHHFQNRYGTSMVEISERREDAAGLLDELPAGIQKILQTCSRLSEKLDIPVYLVGGMVRDMLLDRENRDIDLVIEGEIKSFLQELAEELKAEYQFHERFQTGTLTLSGEYNLDLARARSEFYPSPGARPQVEQAGLLEDLFRRDFTINAMAVELSREEYGLLYDFFGACADLDREYIRALHRFSFLDDPTRIIRGLKYALELDFHIEEETEKLMDEALKRGDFSRLKLNRVFQELKDLVRSYHNHQRFAALMHRLPAFKLLAYDFEFDRERWESWEDLSESLEYLCSRDYNIKEWGVKLAFLLENMPFAYRDRLSLSEEVADLLDFLAGIDDFIAKLERDDDPVSLNENLSRLSPEKLALLYFSAPDQKFRETLEYFIEELAGAGLSIDGNDMLELGLDPGPAVQEVLDQVWAEYLQGGVESREEQLKLAASLIRERNGG